MPPISIFFEVHNFDFSNIFIGVGSPITGRAITMPVSEFNAAISTAISTAIDSGFNLTAIVGDILFGVVDGSYHFIVEGDPSFAMLDVDYAILRGDHVMVGMDLTNLTKEEEEKYRLFLQSERKIASLSDRLIFASGLIFIVEYCFELYAGHGFIQELVANTADHMATHIANTAFHNMFFPPNTNITFAQEEVWIPFFEEPFILNMPIFPEGTFPGERWTWP